MTSRYKMNKKNTICLMVFLGLILAFAFSIFIYEDLVVTIDNANLFLSSIRHGDLLDFYENTVRDASTVFAANYNLEVYIIFGLWQAPMYLLTHLLGKTYIEWTPALLWSKLLLVLFSFLAAYMIFKITVLCTKKHKWGRFSVFLFYSNMLVFLPLFICGQIDVISIALMLWGLYYYLKGNFKYFYLIFLVAVPLKMFVLFMALPLIMAKKKKLLTTLALTGFLPVLIYIEQFIFRKSTIHYYALESQSREAIYNLLNAKISLGANLVLFVLVYLSLLIYIYIKGELSQREVIYSCFLIWGCFIIFSGITTYWVILAAPFLVLNMCINRRFLRATVLVDTLGLFCYMLSAALHGSMVFRYQGLMTDMVWPTANRSLLKYGTFYNMLTRMNLLYLKNAFSSVYVTAVIALLVLTCPLLQMAGRCKKRRVSEPLTSHVTGHVTGHVAEANLVKWEGPETSVLWLRPVLLLLTSVVIIYAYTKTSNPISFDTRSDKCSFHIANLVGYDKQDTISQKITMDSDRCLDELLIRLHREPAWRINMSVLTVELWDVQAKKTIFRKEIGCSRISNDYDCTIELDGTRVEKGKSYEIRLSGLPGVEALKDTTKLNVYMSSVYVKSMETAKANGKNTHQWLYFMLR